MNEMEKQQRMLADINLRPLHAFIHTCAPKTAKMHIYNTHTHTHHEHTRNWKDKKKRNRQMSK